jgi:hypothetical protein
MWIAFNNKDLNNQPDSNYPPEGYDVMTTDGNQEAIMWYLMSSEYKWNFQDPQDSDNFFTDNHPQFPFQPTHWMSLEDYKVYKRDKQLESILDERS